jgi:hypothetical protein
VLDHGLDEKGNHTVSAFALLVARSCKANFKSAREQLYALRSRYPISIKILDDISDVCFYHLQGFPDHVIKHCFLDPQYSRELPCRKSKTIPVDLVKQQCKDRVLKKGMSGTSSAFVMNWLEAAPSLQRAFCRVEGTDDVLLLESMLTFILPDVQKKSDASDPNAWADFTFSFGNDGQLPQLRLICQKVPPSQIQIKCGGVCEQEFDECLNFLQDCYSVAFKKKKFSFVWTDIVDNDLNAAPALSDLRAELGDEPYNDSRCVMFHRWKWGRAIENILLPPETPLLVLRKNSDKSAEFTREVFEVISKHFFPIDRKFRSFSEWTKSADFLKVGCGWSAFDGYTVAEFKDKRHYECLRLLGHRLFSIRVVSAVYDLMHQNPETCAVHSSLFLSFFEMMQLISKEPGEESSDTSRNKKPAQKKNEERTRLFNCFGDVVTAVQHSAKLPDSLSCYGDLRDHLNEFAKESWKCMDDGKRYEVSCKKKFCARHNSIQFWFYFPRLCSFLAHLCVLDGTNFPSLNVAARDLLLLIQHAICVVAFDLPVHTTPAPSHVLFELKSSFLSSAERPCVGFLPMVERNHGSGRPKEGRCAFDQRIDLDNVTCASCGHNARDHVLRTHFDTPIRLESFFTHFARIGSIAWSPHDYPEIAIERGRRQIGFSFQVGNVKVDGSGESQQQYRQRVEAVMREFQPQDARNMFSEGDAKILGDCGVDRVIDSMRQLQTLRREELRAVALALRKRLLPSEQSAAEGGSAVPPEKFLPETEPTPPYLDPPVPRPNIQKRMMILLRSWWSFLLMRSPLYKAAAAVVAIIAIFVTARKLRSRQQ